ncbi:hypothetical protein BDZ89DRAFT_1134661 [Hymenopellis radicata]|nr:hypothetical protein BDZ89DRAFT_1134661 [Hymenopellis radicata]
MNGDEPILSHLPEDMDFDDDDLIKFDYVRHVRLYTLSVLLTTVAAFALSTIPLWLLATPTSGGVIRADDVLTPLALWALSYTLQKHVDDWSPWWRVTALLRAALHTLLLLSAPYLLRLAHHADFPMPSKRDEAVFVRTWVVGTTWALVEAFVSIRGAYRSMRLYEPQPPHLLDDEDADDLDEEASVISTNLSLLNTLHKREEMEAALAGVAFIDIPLFILALQRVTMVLLSLGTTLLLSATWYPRMTFGYSLGVTLGCFAVQALIGNLRAPQVRVYVGLVLGLGVFFAGLGVWGVLE